MIPVEDALARVFALVSALEVEPVPLAEADGRVLRAPLAARRDQPPCDVSAMDGYAVNGTGPRLRVVGAAAAGVPFDGTLAPGEAARIFTGAQVPRGADRVVIQEDVKVDGDCIDIKEDCAPGTYIRPRGGDFASGDTLAAPRRLRPVDLALLAAMNLAEVPVSRRPRVALVATGDELVMPGEVPRADQIVASSVFALAAMVRAEGGVAHVLPIARDNRDSLRSVLELARDADMVVTTGGASVGDHDLVRPVLAELDASPAFYKIAMRPGKPLMAGRLGRAVMLGLPGNPVSSIVCGHLFMVPALRAMLGLGAWPRASATARLACDLGANGPRDHYMRARLLPGDAGLPGIEPFARQDSALVSVLAEADALLVRPARAAPAPRGTPVRYIPLQAS
ncbi:MAG: molybdopterin molybdotransferase MoeA [Rhodobacteraceae bacterium]|nr:molybdopterin molybdotransferase MoeA [Paracoccaceae bacterium]